MFEGFHRESVETAGARINVRYHGNGSPLLLLHGHPQTHVAWHRVAPRLAEEFTVVVPDLRGYGDSSKPESSPDHSTYSKRAMAEDQVEVMRHLGFDRFDVAGHDRGARCAYRMALDFPTCVRRLTVLDVIPTGEALRRANTIFAMAYWRWFFLAQPYPLPERLIENDPESFYFRWRNPSVGTSLFGEEAYAEYVRAVSEPRTIHAMCEDYRAGVSVDFDHDEADRGVRRIGCPVLILWSARDSIHALYDVLRIWRNWADDVRGRAVDAGHFLPEEVPGEIIRELRDFLL